MLFVRFSSSTVVSAMTGGASKVAELRILNKQRWEAQKEQHDLHNDIQQISVPVPTAGVLFKRFKTDFTPLSNKGQYNIPSTSVVNKAHFSKTNINQLTQTRTNNPQRPHSLLVYQVGTLKLFGCCGWKLTAVNLRPTLEYITAPNDD